MRWYHVTTFLTFLAYQTAPQPTADSLRRYGIAAMFGAGQYEIATFDCEGNLVSSEALAVSDFGIRADAEVARGVTLSGSWSHSRSRLPAWTADQRVDVYTGRMTFDWSWGGIGAGGMWRSGLWQGDEGQLPSLHLRLGRRDQSHFVLDVAPPSETYYVTGLARIGVGFRQGIVGLAFGPDGQTSLSSEFAIPVSPSLDLLARGYFGKGNETPHYGVAGGLRLRM